MLFPFQQEALQFIEAHQGRVLIAFEMGLGKTIISLNWLKNHPELRPAIIVSPATAKLNWRNEILTWLPNEPHIILAGETSSSLYDYSQHLIIINYDILQYWGKELLRIKPQALILDEVQLIKNKDALRTKAAMFLAKESDTLQKKHLVPYILALSGTPVISRPVEFYNIISLLNPTLFPNEWDYLRKYCDAKKLVVGWRYDKKTKTRKPKYKIVGWKWSPITKKIEPRYAWDTSGASNLEQLNTILSSTIMTRRLKSEVLTDLPDKIKTIVPLELTNRQNYQDAEAGLAASTKEIYTKINDLKRLVVREKLKAAIAWITDVIAHNKLIVFCIHHEFVDALIKGFGKRAVKLTGNENAKQRQQAIDDFQTKPEIRLFVGNIDAAGIAINLTAASHVAFLELAWTPSAHLQAEDRAHRIGQKNTVNVYYLIAEDTIEENILKLLDKKLKVVTTILDGHDRIGLTPALKHYLKEE